MSAKWSLMFLLSLLIIAGCSLTAQADYLLEELPCLHNSVVAVASVLNNGRDQIISGLGNELRIYDQGVLIGTITGFAGNVTAVAAGDLTGDFRPEIIIGTDNFNFYVYQHVQGTWRQVVERRYLWSPVVRLLVADITGNGWGDVVVLTERGEAFVYLGWDGELDLFWRSQPNANVKYVCAGDLDGNGGDEVIYAYHSGYVGVLGWMDGQLELLWQNYPWGTIDSVFLAETRLGELPELVVVTGQNIFYAWRYNGESLSTVRHFPAEFDGRVIKFLPELGIVNMSGRSGVSRYTIGTSSLNHVESLPLFSVQDLIPTNGGYLVKETDGSYYRLHQVDPETIEIRYNSKTLSGSIEAKLYNGRVFLDLDGLASALSLIRFGSQRIFLISRLNYMVIDPGSSMVTWRNMKLPLMENVLVEDRKFYLPLSLLPVLGYESEYDYESHMLTIRRTWGWWW